MLIERRCLYFYSQISLPRFQDIDWRVDITSASDQMHRMNLPSVIVQLKVITINFFF